MKNPFRRLSKPKILLAPMNVANMPMTLVRELRKQGYKANHIQYTYGDRNKFGFDTDLVVNLRDKGGRIDGQLITLRECLDFDYDIFHFWNRTLFYRADHSQNSAFDLFLLKSRRKKNNL